MNESINESLSNNNNTGIYNILWENNTIHHGKDNII